MTTTQRTERLLGKLFNCRPSTVSRRFRRCARELGKLALDKHQEKLKSSAPVPAATPRPETAT